MIFLSDSLQNFFGYRKNNFASIFGRNFYQQHLRNFHMFDIRDFLEHFQVILETFFLSLLDIPAKCLDIPNEYSMHLTSLQLIYRTQNTQHFGFRIVPNQMDPRQFTLKTWYISAFAAFERNIIEHVRTIRKTKKARFFNVFNVNCRGSI